MSNGWAMELVDGFPRRNRLDHQTPAEEAIRRARDIVENSGCGIHLTKAVTLLGEALDAVADHHEGKPEDTPSETAATAAKVGESRNVSDAITAGDTKIAEPVPEKVLYQNLVSRYETPNNFERVGEPQADKVKADDIAVAAIQKSYDVQHAFVVRVESAYTREHTVKKRI